ncbi:F-box protein GID2-like [Cynara cardunculus var. scolymus]|uniref:F-box protein GID2 n=1 Tax=Cynara cardunculus var. scolymus TaxID=59895 RepID=A0A103YCS9_CYNCS|nr:F-box protein GID2-like [Cynara cardunculus var. scolymus]KVI06715.1 F-box domain, cyclin-like protein [Cynara cardunculus var. scolymus]
MKRSISFSEDQVNGDGDGDGDVGKMKKKIREDLGPEMVKGMGETPETAISVLMDENLLYEVLKHVDARTLGAAGCVNRQWHRTAQDERLWELICTRHWANIGCGNNQLRSVVLALGGFRRLHSHYLWPLSKPSTSTATSSSSSTVAAAAATASSSSWPCLPPPRTIVPSKPTAVKTRWGKDEVQLSLSLLSIRYYEKMNFNNRK